MYAVALPERELAPEGAPGRTKIEVHVGAINALADAIRSFEFVDPAGAALPPFTPGAHIDVHLPGGIIRQYSICNSATERHRYVVAVLRDPNGRGGSLAMHDALHVGQSVTISAPRNHFALDESAAHHVFIAGGIGITPIMSMIDEVWGRGESFRLFYCARSPERTAFAKALQPLVDAGLASIHYDNGDPRNGLDLDATLATRPPGAHLYYCGPGGLMDAIERSSAHWPQEARHCERFSGSGLPKATPDGEIDQPFDVELRRSGKRFTVNAGQSIVDALRCGGVEVETSCREGYCGTCMTRYVAGEPLHRDSVLDAEDREEFIMICCSRARSATLALDL